MDAMLTQKLKQDLETVITDAEELLKATAGPATERIEKIRARAQESLLAARQRLADAAAVVDENVRATAGSIDDQVHDHPYAAAGIAAGIGLLVGLLIGRSS
jgi:ElaB/YqjD/DUF883 family membrane-anchored ribosome-binding protein